MIWGDIFFGWPLIYWNFLNDLPLFKITIQVQYMVYFYGLNSPTYFTYTPQPLCNEWKLIYGSSNIAT